MQMKAKVLNGNFRTSGLAIGARRSSMFTFVKTARVCADKDLIRKQLNKYSHIEFQLGPVWRSISEGIAISRKDL